MVEGPDRSEQAAAVAEVLVRTGLLGLLWLALLVISAVVRLG